MQANKTIPLPVIPGLFRPVTVSRQKEKGSKRKGVRKEKGSGTFFQSLKSDLSFILYSK